MRVQLALLLGAATAVPAHATTFMEVPFADSVREAPIIVRARAGASTGGWEADSDGTHRIFTYTELEVREALKGALRAGSLIRARELGGSVGDEAMRVAGTARFREGEDAVVLLNEQAHDGSYPVRGMMMAKLRVTRAPDGTERIEGPALVGTARSGGRIWSLADLRAELKGGERPPNRTEKGGASSAEPLTTPLPSAASSESEGDAPVPDVNNQTIKSTAAPNATLPRAYGIALAILALGALAALWARWWWRGRRIALSERRR